MIKAIKNAAQSLNSNVYPYGEKTWITPLEPSEKLFSRRALHEFRFKGNIPELKDNEIKFNFVFKTWQPNLFCRSDYWFCDEEILQQLKNTPEYNSIRAVPINTEKTSNNRYYLLFFLSPQTLIDMKEDELFSIINDTKNERSIKIKKRYKECGIIIDKSIDKDGVVFIDEKIEKIINKEARELIYIIETQVI